MANKFTRSVLERQAKERRTVQQSSASIPTQESPSPNEQVAIKPDAPAIPEIAAEPNPPAEALSDCSTVSTEQAQSEPTTKPTRTRAGKRPAPDLSDFIVRDEGRSAKNKTFYLDAAVIEALHQAALAQKVTDSKLVNDILKKILGV